MGAACFDALTRAGRQALLLEQHRLAHGATGWSGAVVRITHSNAQCAMQAAFGLRFYREMAATHPNLIEFYETGYLHFAEPENVSLLERILTSTDIQARTLSQRQVKALYPELDIRCEQAIYEAQSGFADPVRTTRALVSQGLERGGQMRECSRALDIIVEAGQVTGVETAAGRLRAESVVLATGESTGAFLQKAGLVGEFVWAQLIQVTLFQGTQKLTRGPAFIDDVTGTNGVFDPGSGGLYVGLPTGVVRESQDRLGVLDQAHAETTRLAGQSRFGWLGNARPCGGLCHTDAYSGNPGGLIGPCPGGPEGLLLATGFSGGGFKMAPFAAASIAATVSGQRPIEN